MRPAAAKANEFNDQYEAVRSWALARPRPRGSPAGASVLLRRGLVAWLQAMRDGLPQQQHFPTHTPSTTLLATAPQQQALASLLATLVEYTQQEELR